MMCKLKRGIWQQGRVRRAEDTDVCENKYETKEGTRGMKGIKKTNKEAREKGEKEIKVQKR